MSDYLNCLGCQNTCYPRFSLYNQCVQLGNLAKRILCRESEHLSKFDVNNVIIRARKVNFIVSKKHKLKRKVATARPQVITGHGLLCRTRLVYISPISQRQTGSPTDR